MPNMTFFFPIVLANWINSYYPHLADEDTERRASRYAYGRIVFWEICRRVNEHIGMLPCYSNHLLRPREADMPANDLQIGEFQSNLVDILLILDDFLVHKMESFVYRNGPSNLTWAERTGVSDLC